MEFYSLFRLVVYNLGVQTAEIIEENGLSFQDLWRFTQSLILELSEGPSIMPELRGVLQLKRKVSGKKRAVKIAHLN